MSPAGGVGINLAIQDAVAAANLLAAKLRQGKVTEDDLRRVQQRREMPVRRIQAGQVFVHRRMFGPGGKPFALLLAREEADRPPGAPAAEGGRAGGRPRLPPGAYRDAGRPGRAS